MRKELEKALSVRDNFNGQPQSLLDGCENIFWGIDSNCEMNLLTKYSIELVLWKNETRKSS